MKYLILASNGQRTDWSSLHDTLADARLALADALEAGPDARAWIVPVVADIGPKDDA